MKRKSVSPMFLPWLIVATTIVPFLDRKPCKEVEQAEELKELSSIHPLKERKNKNHDSTTVERIIDYSAGASPTMFVRAAIVLVLVVVLNNMERCWGLLFAPTTIPCARALRSSGHLTTTSMKVVAAPEKISGDDRSSSIRLIEPSRRTVIFRAFSSAASLMVFATGNPQPAMALKERNEALCGTGFFTNIAVYKCTDIGDISDEGKSPPLSTTEEGSMQSLLGKMGMEDVVFVDEKESKNKKNNENKGNNRQQQGSQKSISTTR